MPRKLVFRSTNLYYELTKDAIRKKEKEAMKDFNQENSDRYDR